LYVVAEGPGHRGQRARGRVACGSAATRLLADRTGLTGGLSGALARRGFTPLHDRGRVLADLAVAIADGATTISEIDVLRHQGELFGLVASGSTAWWTLAGCDGSDRPDEPGAGQDPPSRLGPDRCPALAASRRPGQPGGTWARSS